MPSSAENVGACTDNNTQYGEPSEKFIWLERNERVGRSDRYDGERNFRNGRYENIFPKAVAYDGTFKRIRTRVTILNRSSHKR